MNEVESVKISYLFYFRKGIWYLSFSSAYEVFRIYIMFL